ncbi:hypothetical protein AVEN_213034-1, partial [Araneus ventricosus]
MLSDAALEYQGQISMSVENREELSVFSETLLRAFRLAESLKISITCCPG